MTIYYIERVSKITGSQDVIKVNVKSRQNIPHSEGNYWNRIYTLKDLAQYYWDKGYHFYGWEHFGKKYWNELSSSYKKKIMANLETTYKKHPFGKSMHLLEVGI